MNMTSLPFFGIAFIVGSIIGNILLSKGLPIVIVLVVCFTLGILLGFIANVILPKKDK